MNDILFSILCVFGALTVFCLVMFPVILFKNNESEIETNVFKLCNGVEDCMKCCVLNYDKDSFFKYSISTRVEKCNLLCWRTK